MEKLNRSGAIRTADILAPRGEVPPPTPVSLNQSNAPQNAMAGASDQQVQECTICLDPMDLENGPLAAIRPCNHQYHAACISRWQSQNPQHQCPQCRGPITFIERLGNVNAGRLISSAIPGAGLIKWPSSAANDENTSTPSPRWSQPNRPVRPDGQGGGRQTVGENAKCLLDCLANPRLACLMSIMAISVIVRVGVSAGMAALGSAILKNTDFETQPRDVALEAAIGALITVVPVVLLESLLSREPAADEEGSGQRAKLPALGVQALNCYLGNLIVQNPETTAGASVLAGVVGSLVTGAGLSALLCGVTCCFLPCCIAAMMNSSD